MKTVILVDELVKDSKYIICQNCARGSAVLGKGIFNDPEDLRAIQLKHQAEVHIDCAFMGSRLQEAANFYKWKLIKFKSSDFCFIEFIMNRCHP